MIEKINCNNNYDFIDAAYEAAEANKSIAWHTDYASFRWLIDAEAIDGWNGGFDIGNHTTEDAYSDEGDFTIIFISDERITRNVPKGDEAGYLIVVPGKYDCTKENVYDICIALENI